MNHDPVVVSRTSHWDEVPPPIASWHSSSKRFTSFNKGISRPGRARFAAVSDRSVAAAGLNLMTAPSPPIKIVGKSILSTISMPGVCAAPASGRVGGASIMPIGLLAHTNYGFAVILCRQPAGASHAEPGASLASVAYEEARHNG